MKTEFHGHFGNIPAPKSVGEFATLLRDFDFSVGAPVAWRGQADIAWPIASTAQRRLTSTRRDVTASRVLRYTETLLADARRRGLGQVQSQTLSDVELLVRLQHHGAATPLVDFTRNAWVALWFAATDFVDRTGVVVLLEESARLIAEPVATTRVATLAQLQGLGKNVLLEPMLSSPRMAAQKGVLVYPHWGGSVGPLGPFEVYREDLGNDDSCDLHPIAVCPALKGEMSSLWSVAFGYDQASLFPDIDGFGREHGSKRELPWSWSV